MTRHSGANVGGRKVTLSTTGSTKGAGPTCLKDEIADFEGMGAGVLLVDKRTNFQGMRFNNLFLENLFLCSSIATAHCVKLKPLHFNMLNVLYDDQKLMIIVISIFREFQNKKDSCN
jgi:hypothetical protein